MIAINVPPPENPTHRRLLALAERIEAGENPAEELEAELNRLEEFFHNLPEVKSSTAASQADLFRQALEDYHQAALCLEQRQCDQARELCEQALAKLRRSKDSIEDDLESAWELEH